MVLQGSVRIQVNSGPLGKKNKTTTTTTKKKKKQEEKVIYNIKNFFQILIN